MNLKYKLLKPLRINVYEFQHYRPYLLAVLGQGRTGKRLALARAMSCPPSHVSQVVSERTHLTPEQGEMACRYLQLSPQETKYFLTMVSYDRAGTPELKNLYKQILVQTQEDHSSVSGRLKAKSDLPEDVTAKYYSSWIYLAIHLAVQLPTINDRIALAEYLGVAPSLISEATEFLLKNGVLMEGKDGLSSGPFNLFLSRESPHLNNHHLNWRAKAMEQIALRREENLHYTSAFTCSQETVQKIHQNILALIESNIEMIRESKDEDIFAFSIDLFKI